MKRKHRSMQPGSRQPGRKFGVTAPPAGSEWLRHWNIDRALKPEPERLPGTASAPGPFLVGEPAPEVGDIRLLFPDGPSTRSRLCYVALLSRASPTSFLAAPFSRFPAPAFPGEVESGLSAATLRVLCLWNARRISEARASRSWKAGRLPDTLREKLPGLPHPPARGPVLESPDDPRHEYVEEEAAWMLNCLAEPRIAATSLTRYPLFDRTELLPMAAEPGPRADDRRKKGGKRDGRKPRKE